MLNKMKEKIGGYINRLFSFKKESLSKIKECFKKENLLKLKECFKKENLLKIKDKVLKKENWKQYVFIFIIGIYICKKIIPYIFKIRTKWSNKTSFILFKNITFCMNIIDNSFRFIKFSNNLI